MLPGNLHLVPAHRAGTMVDHRAKGVSPRTVFSRLTFCLMNMFTALWFGLCNRAMPQHHSTVSTHLASASPRVTSSRKV